MDRLLRKISILFIPLLMLALHRNTANTETLIDRIKNATYLPEGSVDNAPYSRERVSQFERFLKSILKRAFKIGSTETRGCYSHYPCSVCSWDTYGKWENLDKQKAPLCGAFEMIKNILALLQQVMDYFPITNGRSFPF